MLKLESSDSATKSCVSGTTARSARCRSVQESSPERLNRSVGPRSSPPSVPRATSGSRSMKNRFAPAPSTPFSSARSHQFVALEPMQTRLLASELEPQWTLRRRYRAPRRRRPRRRPREGRLRRMRLRTEVQEDAVRATLARHPSAERETRFRLDTIEPAGRSDSTDGAPSLRALRGRSHIRRGGATTRRAWSADIPWVSLPSPLDGRVASGRGRSTRCRAPRRRGAS